MSKVRMFRSERFRRLAKEGFWVVSGQVLAVLGALLSVRVLTEIMPLAAYGELALGLTLATLINCTLFGPLSNGTSRFYLIACEKNDIRGYLLAVRNLLFSATGLIILLTCAGAITLLISGKPHWSAILVTALLFSILSGYNSILSGIQNAARQRIVVALHRAFESWGKFLVAAGLMLWMGASSVTALIGYSLAVVLVLGSQSLFLKQLSRPNNNKQDMEISWQKQIWQYSWPFGTWGILYWAQSSSDRWALELFSSTQDVGLFAALYHLGFYPMSIATGMAMQFLSPILYQQAGDALDHERIAKVNTLSWRLTRYALIGTFTVFLATLFFHTKIFQLFVAEEFAIVSHLLPWMLLSGGIFAASQTIVLNLMSQMNIHTMMTANIATAILGVIFNLTGAYWYDVTGIVIANMMFSILHFLSMAKVSARVSAKPSIL